mgnify:CR=1 FL=1
MNIADYIIALPNLLGNAIEQNQWIGYFAILIAMFLENLIPPIPSEIIMPLGGFYVNQGQLHFLPVVIAGLVGTVLGAFPWYGIGRLVNEERLEIWLVKYGRWLGISPKDLFKSRLWFGKHGNSLVFWGRLIPGIRTLISVPAGIELMPFLPFLLWTSLGSLIWIILLTTTGLILGESYNQVSIFIDHYSSAVKLILLLILTSIFIWIALRAWLKKSK